MAQSASRRLCLLGPVHVDRIRQAQRGTGENSACVAPRFRSRRTVGLLGYLAGERRSIARESLATLFWPDETPAKGRANLSRELHNLAQILPDSWQSDRQSVAFVSSATTVVDADLIRQLEAQERWEEAAELLNGEFLEGLNLGHNIEFELWLFDERERWRGLSERLLKRVIEGHTRRGRYNDALFHGKRLLRLAPWDEEIQRNMMRLLAWTGQRGAALRQFEICKRALREEVDVEPSPETINLYQQIQAGKFDLPPQLPAFLTEEKARHPFRLPPFVGREGALAQLETYLSSAMAGESRVIFVTGGPGRGKTALLDAFSQLAMRMQPNVLVVNGKCNAYSGLGDPYLPYRDVMAMLTGDVEGRWDAGAISRDHARRLWACFSLVVQVLLDHGSYLLDGFVPAGPLLSRSTAAGSEYAPWLPRLREQVRRIQAGTLEVEQSHLFQQVTNVLTTISREHPLLLILDDIQWADSASISLLFHLGRRLVDADSRLLIACAYRPDEITIDQAGRRHPLAKVLREFKRTFGDVWLDLGQTEESEQRRFINSLLDAEPNRLASDFRSALFDRTAGNPLFTVELLKTMQNRGDLLRDADGAWIAGPKLDWEVIPARVEAVIEERIARLDPELQDLLTIASVEGELFTAQVVAQVLKIPERVILGRLSQDLHRKNRLVREQEEVYVGQWRLFRYQFSHVLFQDYLYKRLSQGERRVLHGEVALALEHLYQEQLDEMAVQLAHHFDLAGDQGQAFHYFNLAGERAARIYASGEAIRHYTQAIQLAESITPDATSLARLHRGRGLASETVGNFRQARSDHETTLQIASTAGEDRAEWRAFLDLGKLWRSRNYLKARDCFEAALELARRSDDPAVQASSLNWMGNWYANDEKSLTAVKYHQEALKIVEKWGDQRELANTLDLLGIANLLGGDLKNSLDYYNRAITLFRELDDRPRLTTSLIGRATIVPALAWLASISARPAPDASNDFKEALRIADELDSAPDKAWALWSLGLLHTVKGHFGFAHEVMQNGLKIATEIGHTEFVVANQCALGILYAELFSPDQALEQLEEAVSLAKKLHSATMFHLASGGLAGVYLILGDPEAARACLEKVITPRTSMDTIGKRYCWVRLAELELVRGDSTLALDITRRLIETAPGMSPGRVITYLWMLKAKTLSAGGGLEDALPNLLAAQVNARATGEHFLMWRIHGSLGHLYEAMGDGDAAGKEYAAASTLIDELSTTIPGEAMKVRFRHGANNFLESQS